MEASGSEAPHRDSVLVEQEMIITENPEAEDDMSQQKRKRGRPPKQQVERPNGNSSSDQHDESSSGIASKGNTKVTEASGSQASHRDSPLAEQEKIITETPEAEDGMSQQKRKRGRPPKPQVEKPNGNSSSDQHDESSSGIASKENTKVIEASGTQASDQDSLLVEQEMVMTETPEAEDAMCQQKRKRGRPPKRQVEKPNGSSSSDNHDESSGGPNPAMVNDGETTDYQQDWPFIKKSPIWATIESMELYQKLPQKPHFSPLKKTKEDCREGLAIAHMVTFANVVQRALSFQIANPTDVINDSLNILIDLENHGYDVDAVRDRLNKMMSWKVDVDLLEDVLVETEKDLEKHEHEKSIVEEEINQLEAKMKGLEEKLVQTVTMKKLKDEEITALQSNLRLVADRVTDVKSAFAKLAATPL